MASGCTGVKVQAASEAPLLPCMFYDAVDLVLRPSGPPVEIYRTRFRNLGFRASSCSFLDWRYHIGKASTMRYYFRNARAP